MSDAEKAIDSGKITVYTEPDGSRYDVDYPPRTKVDVAHIAKEIGLPLYIDFRSPMVDIAAVALWASYNIDSLSANYTDLGKLKGPLTPLLMGGVAVKVLSPTSNEKGPMNRVVKDIDYVIKREQGGLFVKLLSNLSLVAGSKFHHFLTASDKRFNALRAGDRYRIRTLDWTVSEKPRVGWVDILADKIEMRHTVDIKDGFGRAKENLYTIGVSKLLITKCQMIEEIDQSQLALLQRSGQEFRILKYPYYREGKYLIGMEEKDMMDTAALLCDFAERSEKIGEEISAWMKKDEKLQLTFLLNIKNIELRKDWLRLKGVSEGQLSRIDESLNNIMRVLPKKEKKWDKPWWNRDVDIPVFN